MKCKIYLIIILFMFLFSLIPLIKADITFFDYPNDFFIMGSSSETSSAGGSGITGGATSGTVIDGSEGCVYKWNCMNWSECLSSGKQTRTCINIGTCLDNYKTPETEQDCTYSISESKDVEKEIEEKKILYNKIIICSIVLIILIIFYLKRNYFKKLIKNYWD